MKNKKILAIVAIVAVVVVLVLFGVMIFFGGNKNSETDADESDITKYEWLKMLCTQTGMGQGDLWSPVFEDVDRSNNCFSEENAPIVKNWHWEEIPPADKQLVEECTYSKTNDTLPGSDQNANINRNPNTDQRLTPLFGKDIPAYFFVQEILDNGENYTIRGDVYVRDYIEKDRFDTLQPGDTVNSLQGEAYTVESIGNLLVNDPVVIELEKDGEKWYCCKAQEYQFYQFPNTLEGNVAYLPLSTEEEFVGYSQYVSAHAKEAAYEAQGQDVPDEILEITESGPYWAGDDKYTIEDVELTVDKDMPVYDAILGYSYSRKEVEDVIGEYPDMHMYEEGMSFAEAYAADEIQKAQTFSSRFSIVGFYLTGQGNLDLLFSLQFPD